MSTILARRDEMRQDIPTLAGVAESHVFGNEVLSVSTPDIIRQKCLSLVFGDRGNSVYI